MKYFSKKLFLFIFLLAATTNFNCSGAIAGRLTAVVIPVAGQEEEVQVPFFSASASYENGGLTFTYPSGLFSTTPSVRVSAELSGASYSSSQTVSTQITSNSTTSTTVRVNLGTVLSITEAADDDVIVHLFANEVEIPEE